MRAEGKPLRKWVIQCQSGREFIIYAKTSAAARRRLEESFEHEEIVVIGCVEEER